MIMPTTNAQVALQAAVAWYSVYSVSATQDEIERKAVEFLRWLNAHTPPAADQPGELG